MATAKIKQAYNATGQLPNGQKVVVYLHLGITVNVIKKGDTQTLIERVREFELDHPLPFMRRKRTVRERVMVPTHILGL